MVNLSPIDLKIILCFCFAGGITFFLVPSIVEMSNLKSLVAVPNRRTSHDAAVPNLGGIAIYIGVIIAYLLFLESTSFPHFQFLVASTMIIFFVGFKDDITGLSAFKKFFGQIVAAWILVSFGGMRLTHLYGFFGLMEIDYSLSYLISMIAVIGITNCFNLMDGIDGLSAGLAIVSSVFFGAWFYFIGDYDWAILSFGLSGSLVAFGYFNVFGHKNKIFMGDTGSLTIGFIISAFAIHFNQKNLEPGLLLPVSSAPAVSIGFLMVPLFDTLRVMITRLMHRASPFDPDKTHIHHYLLRMGLSHLQSTLLLMGIAVVFCFISFLLRDIGVARLLLILFILSGAVFYYIINRSLKSNPITRES